jgi:hypothetical protein
MDALSGAAGAVAGLLKHGKAKLVWADAGGGGGDSGGFGALAGAALSALPIPGLGTEDKDTELTFMFNPTEYRISQGVNVKRTSSTTVAPGTVEYLSTNPMTLSMQLFFDDFASMQGDVTSKITKLLDWQRPKDGKAPPLVKFEWGNKQLEQFTGVITQLNCAYTVFRKDGTPVQAKVDVTIEGQVKAKPGKNPTSHAIAMRRMHTVVEGESLAGIATAELGRPEYWRGLAELNGVDDPLRVKPGSPLLIPSAADAARNS